MMIRDHTMAVLIVLCAGLVSCSDGMVGFTDVKDADQIVHGTGTIEFLEVEVGCFVLRTDENVTLEPGGLPDEFEQDGLRVRFVAKVLPHVISVCQVGTIVQILEIEAL